MSVSAFLDEHFRHFNARETVAAARAWSEHLDAGGKMFLAMAGAMSTAEIGRILSPLIRAGKVHAICATAAKKLRLADQVSGNDSKAAPQKPSKKSNTKQSAKKTASKKKATPKKAAAKKTAAKKSANTAVGASGVRKVATKRSARAS
jgi:hypothetical protein